jgi:hypothetical protein
MRLPLPYYRCPTVRCPLRQGVIHCTVKSAEQRCVKVRFLSPPSTLPPSFLAGVVVGIQGCCGVSTQPFPSPLPPTPAGIVLGTQSRSGLSTNPFPFPVTPCRDRCGCPGSLWGFYIPLSSPPFIPCRIVVGTQDRCWVTTNPSSPLYPLLLQETLWEPRVVLGFIKSRSLSFNPLPLQGNCGNQGSLWGTYKPLPLPFPILPP